ncbi:MULTISPECIES: cation diffusion facilitator family transporter [Pseudanabaena]|uniref:cation diffusion facilitator family transporter n=1 Tax=Pseudanabaena TaxID=1152 RepID=UPI002478D6E1|nr:MULTISPECIES: cation diffusion facilitator family transporter [Pseudanabaena]MEA5485331.1 cation diffusion facilitator family transporter [Pseudanabaena sp. CCNP1317]WGS72540.1 cation diffusion facilitator family transporter [Pseudanabaena galeata CCNP1313]
MQNKSARYYGFLSIGAALLTIALKLGAYLLTNSVGFLSDSLESGVNLVAAIGAVWALTYAAKPPDEEHTFGHSKAEYFSSGFEGALILVAAVSIAIAAIPRLLNPQPLEQLSFGLVLSVVASAINGITALILLQAGKRLRSITLRADAHHLLTDVWTSVGVILGLLLVSVTGWLILDPLIALLVAANIVWTGVKLIQESGSALLDASIPLEERQMIDKILSHYDRHQVQFHAIRTRMAGTKKFVSFHILVSGNWSIQQGHDLCEEVETAISKALPHVNVFTHLEPLEDPKSWTDQDL